MAFPRRSFLILSACLGLLTAGVDVTAGDPAEHGPGDGALPAAAVDLSTGGSPADEGADASKTAAATSSHETTTAVAVTAGSTVYSKEFKKGRPPR